jgi:hypothetical protein
MLETRAPSEKKRRKRIGENEFPPKTFLELSISTRKNPIFFQSSK